MKKSNGIKLGLLSASLLLLASTSFAQDIGTSSPPGSKEKQVQKIDSYYISLPIAKTMAQAALDKAKALKLKIVVSIYDGSGNLKYFERMDDTSSGSIKVSQLKAKTSAAFPTTTRALAEKSSKMQGNPYASIKGFTILPGGLPIFNSQGGHVGGIGVSGATPAQDEECAQAGVDAVSHTIYD